MAHHTRADDAAVVRNDVGDLGTLRLARVAGFGLLRISNGRVARVDAARDGCDRSGADGLGESGPGEGVDKVVLEQIGDKEALVVGRVPAGERNSLGGDCLGRRRTSTDAKLNASRVKLRAVLLLSKVQCDQFVAHNVVAGGKVRRESKRVTLSIL